MALWHGQAMRFAMVGVASNFLLYVMYLALTAMGVGHIAAMTGLYACGVLQTFVFNRRVTFHHAGSTIRSLLRYITSYGACYGLNLAALLLFVNQLGFPHWAVQGMAIVVIAALLFLLQKFWVFAAIDAGVPKTKHDSTGT